MPSARTITKSLTREELEGRVVSILMSAPKPDEETDEKEPENFGYATQIRANGFLAFAFVYGSLARIPSAIWVSTQSRDTTRGDPWWPVETRGEWFYMSGMINYQHRNHLRPPW